MDSGQRYRRLPQQVPVQCRPDHQTNSGITDDPASISSARTAQLATLAQYFYTLFSRKLEAGTPTNRAVPDAAHRQSRAGLCCEHHRQRERAPIRPSVTRLEFEEAVPRETDCGVHAAKLLMDSERTDKNYYSAGYLERLSITEIDRALLQEGYPKYSETPGLSTAVVRLSSKAGGDQGLQTGIRLQNGQRSAGQGLRWLL
uniref:Ubiquitinyl hydrolase 1 n=1 Tax=Macrostomum lignano TaxID=282301 RepID=A0A1I8FIW3_9PLAT